MRPSSIDGVVGCALRRGVVVLLEFDQVGRFFVQVDPRQRIAVVGGLLENRRGRLAIQTRLSGQGANPFDQIAVAIGETHTGTSWRGGIDADGRLRLQVGQFQRVAVVGYAIRIEGNGEGVALLRPAAEGQAQGAAIGQLQFVAIGLPGLKGGRCGRRTIGVDTGQGGASRHGEITGGLVVGQGYRQSAG
jgi:hypothetical protein